MAKGSSSVAPRAISRVGAHGPEMDLGRGVYPVLKEGNPRSIDEPRKIALVCVKYKNRKQFCYSWTT